MKIDLKQISPPPAPPPPKRYQLNLELDYAELCLLLRVFGRAGGAQEVFDITTPIYTKIRDLEFQIGQDADRFTFHSHEHTIRFTNAPAVLADLRAKHP